MEKTLIDGYEEGALINAVNHISQDYEKYRINIFTDGDDPMPHKHTDYRFEVGYKYLVAADVERKEEYESIKKIVDFLNSFHFVRDLKELDEIGITRAKSERLYEGFYQGIKKCNAKRIYKVIGAEK